MKSYPNIITKLFYEPALITPARHAAICQLLDARLSASGPRDLAGPCQPLPGAESDEDDAAEMERKKTVAIIPVHGTIVPHPEDIAMSECGCALEELNAMIDAAEADPRIATVIYDFRSPGGSVTGVPETGRKIALSAKDTIAFTDSECCSGALWLAAQCQRFYATGSSRVGSVGVYTMYLDYSAALKKAGVKVDAIFAGKYKLLGAYWKPLKDEERAILQARVDKIYGQFKQAMTTYREVSDEHFGNGLVFDGEEAAEMGFTDGTVDSIKDILEEMVE